MADALDSKSSGGDPVSVRVRPPAPKLAKTRVFFLKCGFLLCNFAVFICALD